MADFYTGPNGSPTGVATSWATRRDTIAGGLSVAHSAGDRLYVGPGVYREQVTLPQGGEDHDWTGGTVSVTEGSKIVTGAGTGWASGNAQAGDVLFIPWLAQAGDGVGAAPGAGFTSASNPFEASYVGFCINVQTQGSYKIATYVNPGSITLTDVNVVGFPGVGPNNFYVPSNEGSYEIESVDSDTQITLARPWSGPTCIGLDYEMWRPVYLIGDETGAHTDGVGGVCRITGSDNDQTPVRPHCIFANGESYWTIRGFQVDSTAKTNNNGDNIKIDDGEGFTIEDIRSLNPAREHIYLDGIGDRITVRRCAFFGGLASTGIRLSDNVPRWTAVNHFENIYAACYLPFEISYFANTTIKNCTNGMGSEHFLETVNVSLGGCVFIHDCEIHYCDEVALEDAVNGQILVDWCNFWDNNGDIANGTLGANCEADNYLYLPDLPRLLDSYRYPVRFYPPSQWWGVAFQGLYAANQDIYGVPKPTTDTKLNWGFQQTHYIERDTATVYGGEEASMEHIDARTTQFRIASSGDPVTVTVFVRRETNYAGTLPKLIVHQAGNTDVEATAIGAVDTWEQLSVSYTPNAQPPIIWASVVTDNTAVGALIATYWQRLSDVLT